VEGEASDLVGAMTEWVASGQSRGLSPAIAPGFVGCIYEPVTDVVERR